MFLLFGVFARRDAAAGLRQPVPQALVITGIVLSSATALAVALLVRLNKKQVRSSSRRLPKTTGEQGALP